MSKEHLQIDKQHIWHPYSSIFNQDDSVLIESAQGIYLNTADGRKIIDAVASWWLNIHGHSHPYIAQKIYEQALVLEHVIFAGFTHTPATTLVKRILNLLPHMNRAFFSDNGSTAVEVAIKLVIQYWKNSGNPRTRFIAIEGAFHGDTFGAMAVSDRGVFTDVFKDLLFDVTFIPFPDKDKEIDSVEVLISELEKGDVAAFIYEPLIQGAAGMRTYSTDVLKRLLMVAKEYDVLCIADEVFTGFGRTGRLFASDYLAAKPDIICLSKGLTGGTLPMGLTLCNSNVEAPFLKDDGTQHVFYHGHSFTANPLACAAANASLDLILTEDCYRKIKMIEAAHQEFLKSIEADRRIKRIESLGTILAIEFFTKENSGYLNDLRSFLYKFFMSRNVLLRPLGNVIYIIPPYVIEKEELDIVYSAIRDLLGEVK